MMIRRIAISIALLMVLSVTAQRRISINGLTVKNDIYYYKNKPYTGKTVELHDNKTIAQQINWVNGKMNGLRTEWFANGKRIIKSKVNFKNNQRHGGFEVFYGNGTPKVRGSYFKNSFDKKIERWYLNGVKNYEKHYKQGIKNGESFVWFESGKKQQKGYFINGKADGEFLSWYPTGKLRRKEHYKNGYRHGQFNSWHRNGKIAEKSNFFEGFYHNKRESWGIRGGQILEQNYFKGKKNGKWISFGLTGDTLVANQYKMDKLDGRQVKYERRVLESLTYYKNGLKTGYWQTGLVSNKGHSIGNYKNDKRVGVWTFYDIDGKILIKITYDTNGNKIKEEK